MVARRDFGQNGVEIGKSKRFAGQRGTILKRHEGQVEHDS
jgi:hypothetical protein